MTHADFEHLTIIEFFETINKKYGDITALQIKGSDGAFRKLSYAELGKKTINASSALIQLGISKGDRVAILSENRPEWAVACFGIVSCAGVIVPVDTKLSEKEIQFILNHSRAKCVFVSGDNLPVVESLRSVLPHLEHVILLDGIKHHDEILLQDLKLQKREERRREILPEDTGVIVYTSGTTGVAKGVELSYRSLVFQARVLDQVIEYDSNDNFLSILPLNHMLEFTGGLMAPLYAGACITYCDSFKPSDISALMVETRTTAMICVPLVLKMLYAGILREAAKLPRLKKFVFESALNGLKRISGKNGWLGRLIFKEVHKKFGGRLRGFVSGGAPLDSDVEKGLNALGFMVLQGYGLTETAPVITVNTLKDHKFGSVGKPLPGVTVNINKKKESDAEGEILTRGPHVMKGYLEDTDKTSEVMKDGWLHTGDLGYVDDDGFLHICGRSRNLIVLGAGKKVFPEEVEEVMGKSQYIKEICVLPRKAEKGLRKGHEEVYAVIVPDADFISKDVKPSDADDVKSLIAMELSRLSSDLAEYKRITDFEIWNEDLPRTASRKIKRKEVSSRIV